MTTNLLFIFLEPLSSLLSHLSICAPRQPTAFLPALSSSRCCIADRLVRAAAQGESGTVEELLASYPDQVDAKHGGKTSLQVVAHQGHTTLVSKLLSSGASLEIADDEGDRYI